VVMTVAIALFPLIRTAWDAYALNVLLGSGSGSFAPSQSSMLTGLAPVGARHSAFALQRLTMNLGVALGGLTGGTIARVAHRSAFTILFLLDAATFVGYAIVAFTLPTPAPHKEQTQGTYSQVIRDGPFM